MEVAVYVSRETPRQTHARLLKVLAAAKKEVLTGTYTFLEVPVSEAPQPATHGALAYVRDDEVWSRLVPSADPERELFTVIRFQFQEGLDNSGFVGWLASHLKANLGTGVFVVCGQNSRRGGIFDYLGCPARLREQVTLAIEKLESGANGGADSAQSGGGLLDGVRMRVVATGDQGQVGPGTLLEFAQQGSTVTARYAGGKIRVGHLVGTITEARLVFRFAQVDEEGLLHGGISTCDIDRAEAGRLRVIEHFQWESRQGSGTNVYEQIPAEQSWRQR